MKIYYKTFGCRVNQIETQSILEKFSEIGYEISNDEENADIVFINSCSVTEKADKDVLNFIKKASKKDVKIIITGCYASLFPDKIKNINENVEIFDNNKKEDIVSIITGKKIEKDFFKVKTFYGRTRAFIKIQDGCNLKCSYCIVPFGRREIKSKRFLDVISEVKNLINNDYKEIVLSGTRLGYYRCPEKNYNLCDLLSELFSIDGDFRVRLSSLEPMEISENLIKVFKEGREKFCEYLHLSIQSASSKVLKFMKRPYDEDFLKDIICLIKENFNDIGLFADIISSFPMETEEDFWKTYNFLLKYNFSGIHSFTYSKRPFTQAQQYKDLPKEIKLFRSNKMKELDKKLRENFAKSLINKKQKVLTLKRKENFIVGLSSNFQNIYINDKNIKTNMFYNVLISNYSNNCLFGKIC